MHSIRFFPFFLSFLVVVSACPTPPFCGDGILDVGEVCDDGNNLDNDGCRSNCAVEICGDGV